MLTRKTAIFAIAVVALATAPIAPAAAGGHGFIHPWGLGRGVVGAVAALVTLPLVIASAVLTGDAAGEPQPGYGGPSPGYYPQPNYYAPPPAYYAAPAYYGAPHGYYAPSYGYGRGPGNYDARAYSSGRSGYHGGYGGNVPSRSGRPGYRR